jgi:hypothetical protein
MQTSKVYIHKNPEGMWEVGVIIVVKGEEVYLNKHEASRWHEAGKWVEEHYVA